MPFSPSQRFFYGASRTITILFQCLSVAKPVLVSWENTGLSLSRKPESKAHKTTLQFNEGVFLRAGIYDLSFSNACAHQHSELETVYFPFA